jgi:hypothetical protein
MDLPKGKKYDEVLSIVSSQITESRDYVRTKREEFRNRLRLYNNQKKRKDKVGDTLLYDLMNTALSIYYIDEMQIKFNGRNSLANNKANYIDKIAQFDYDEMEMSKVDYLTQWDRLFYGVGIKRISEWNKRIKAPIACSMDVLSWLPDPAGHTYMENFRYMGFETQYNEEDMTEDAGFDKAKVESLEDPKNEELELNKIAKDNASNLDTPRDLHDVYECVDLFTIIGGEKYLITIDGELKTIVRCVMLEPVTDEEKEDHSLIPFPLSLHYYSPTRNDPFGVSMGDLAEDKQRAIAKLKNLRIEFTQSQLYPMYLYNRDKIKNKRDLDFDFNKFIGVSAGLDGSLGGIVEPMNKAMMNTNAVMNDEYGLRTDAEKATGVNQIVQGFVMKDATLGESQQAQANANLRIALGSLINNWGEVRFWKLWYRLYRANAPKEKSIRIKTSIGNKYFTIERDNFIGKEDPDIEIISKIEADRQKNNDRLTFTQIYPLISQDPTKPLISKRYAERKLLSLSNLEDDEISILSPKTKDEVRAENENELLQRKEMLDAKEEEDHLTHIIIHSQVIPNMALDAHMLQHWTMYETSGQAEQDARLQQMATMNQMQGGNANANSMVNAAGMQQASESAAQSNIQTNQNNQ